MFILFCSIIILLIRAFMPPSSEVILPLVVKVPMAGDALEVPICVEVPSGEAMLRVPFVWVVKAAHDNNISKKHS
jgi:hypothetical protein